MATEAEKRSAQRILNHPPPNSLAAQREIRGYISCLRSSALQRLRAKKGFTFGLGLTF
jgi:hypothetical protein